MTLSRAGSHQNHLGDEGDLFSLLHPYNYNLLYEDGTNLLLEDGVSFLLLEP